jgi:hypothetical protein
MIKSILNKITKHLPKFTIITDGERYLSRFYPLLKDRDFGNIYIHHFHRSDLDQGEKGFGLLHNHPWPWAFSIVLVNGYMEERRTSTGNVIVKLVKPGDINFLTHHDYHRVQLLGEDAWSIFITGPRKPNMDWYFWDRVSNVYTHWKNKPGAIA